MGIGSGNVQSEYDIYEHDKLQTQRAKARPQRYYAPDWDRMREEDNV
jgi:hypothetical protein